VHDGIDPGYGPLDAALLKIDIDHFHRLALQPAAVTGRPYCAADTVPGLEEQIDGVTPDEAGAAGYQDRLAFSHVYEV
jgi:hypothetical protein